MKKKMLVALFAMMSVASASAYDVVVNNQTNLKIAVGFKPKGVAEYVSVNPQGTQRINLSQPATSITISAAGKRIRKRRRDEELLPASFNIPQQKRGKNITLTVTVSRRANFQWFVIK